MGNAGAHLASLKKDQQLHLQELVCTCVAVNSWWCPVVTKNVGINQTDVSIKRQALLYSQRLVCV